MEYIPGYTKAVTYVKGVPGRVYEYLTAKKVNQYELFEGSVTGGFFGSTPSNIDDSKISLWNSNRLYSSNDQVRYNGFVYTSIASSNQSNISPVQKQEGEYLTFNSQVWQWTRVSSTVKSFDPDKDFSNSYAVGDIVDEPNLGILYSCGSNTANNCKPPFTQSNNWVNLGYDTARAPPVDNSSVGKMNTYLTNAFSNFNIEVIENESYSDTFFRMWDAIKGNVWDAAFFIVAFIFASFAANDMLWKETPYRILAFCFTWMFVAGQTALGWLLILYYLFRSIWVAWAGIPNSLDMHPLKIYSFLPLYPSEYHLLTSKYPGFFTYPAKLEPVIKMVQAEMKQARIDSIGDVKGMINRALGKAAVLLTAAAPGVPVPPLAAVPPPGPQGAAPVNRLPTVAVRGAEPPAPTVAPP
jgi:hypothetical protein